MAKFAKPVAFNEKNEKDRLMLKHVKRRNFSGYVKKLIWEDMNIKKQETTENELPAQSDEVIKESVKNESIVTPAYAPKQLTAAERIEQLKAQTKRQQTPASPPPFIINQQQR